MPKVRSKKKDEAANPATTATSTIPQQTPVPTPEKQPVPN